MSDNTIILEKFRRAVIDDEHNKQFTEKGWMPIYNIGLNSKILIVGQAPGLLAQESGVIWNDASGDRLRKWLGVEKEIFFNTDYFSLIPMDFYYPGKGKSGDLPPRRDFSKKWHPKILDILSHRQLIILAGRYAQKYYLKSNENSLTETVKAYRNFLPAYFPIPHPSPLNFRWIKNNPWFLTDILPKLQSMVGKILNDQTKK